MRTVVLLILQSGATAAVQPSNDPLTLQRLSVGDRCSEETADIIVCGRRDDRYRLPRLDSDRFEPRAAKAEIDLGGNLKGAAEVESATIGPGLTSNRMMLRLKLPF